MLKDVEKVAKEFDNDALKIAQELKKVQSIKCRLKKCKGKSSYEKDMANVLKREQVLKEARALLVPKDKPITMYELEDVKKLDYDETIKAIRSIQSKKTLTRWLTTIDGDNDEFRSACKIEQMLIEHRNNIKPLDDNEVRKSDVQKIIDTIEASGNLSQERIVELLKTLL